MTDNNRIRKGSLQFYPRVRAKKVVPSVNWKPVKRDDLGLLGFIGYKVGMVSVLAKDNTENSMTKSKKIIVPATVIECPPMRIYSVRFYKKDKIIGETVVANDKIIKRKTKVPKKVKELKVFEDYDEIRVIVYSGVFKTGIGKKKPDMVEIGLSGQKDEVLNFVKEKIGKEISVSEVFNPELVDVRGVTKGFGTQGPVKRFGIALKDHKSEKGRRRPGSLAPWHPARVTFRAPMAGQTGYHNRITYNSLILDIAKITEKNINPTKGFEHYGKIKTDYILLRGSIPGTRKRGILLTAPIRVSKGQIKRKLEVLEIR